MLHLRCFSQFSSPHHGKQNFCCLIQCRSMKYSNKRAYAMYSYICKSNQVEINLALCRLKTCVLFCFFQIVCSSFFIYVLFSCRFKTYVIFPFFARLLPLIYVRLQPFVLFSPLLVYIVPTNSIKQEARLCRAHQLDKINQTSACRQLSLNQFVTLAVIQSKTYVYI